MVLRTETDLERWIMLEILKVPLTLWEMMMAIMKWMVSHWELMIHLGSY